MRIYPLTFVRDIKSRLQELIQMVVLMQLIHCCPKCRRGFIPRFLRDIKSSLQELMLMIGFNSIYTFDGAIVGAGLPRACCVT